MSLPNDIWDHFEKHRIVQDALGHHYLKYVRHPAARLSSEILCGNFAMGQVVPQRNGCGR